MVNCGAESDVERRRQSVEIWSSAAKIPWRIVRCGHLIRAPLTSPLNVDPACPICQQPVPRALGKAVSYVRDYVPGQSLSWQTAHKKRKLSPQTSAQFEFETMLARMSTGQQQLDLTHQCPHAQPTSAQAASFLVWRAAPAGCTVRQGTITLPKDGILLLAGHGAHFTGTTFSGGFLMCAGADFNGRFQHCTFRQCTLYAVHGACVHLHACTFDRGVPAVVASGAATAANFASCVFHACRSAVVADRGASIAMRGCAIIGSASAVVVNDPGSHAAVEETHVMAPESGPPVMHACAVMAGSGGGARMHACEVRSVSYPVFGCASSVEVRSTRITKYSHAVGATMNARVAMCDVDMQNRPGVGPAEEKYKSSVDTVRNSQGDRRSAVVQMHRCRMHATTGNGVMLHSGLADVLLCVLSCPGAAVTVGGGTATASAHVRFCAAHTTGDEATFQVASRTPGPRIAALRMHGCRLRADKGRCAFASDAALAARDTQFEGGLPATSRGVLHLLDCTAALCRCTIRSFTVGVMLKGSSVRLIDTGIVSRKLGIEHCHVPGTAWTHGAMHAIAARVCTGRFVMHGGTTKGFEHGVLATVDEATDTAFMQLEGVCFDACYYGVMGSRRLTAEVRRCRFVGCDVVRAREVASHVASGSTDDKYPRGVVLGDVDG
eukprot:jgi/Ulvmu1/1016/UM104_0001.1